MSLTNQPDDIIRYICTFLSFCDALIMYQTSKRFNKIITYTDKTTLTYLRKRLKKLDIDPDNFCNMLVKYDAVISGSFPLQIITGNEWTSDIDIYTYTTKIRHAIDKFGYKLIHKMTDNQMGQTNYDDINIKVIYYYEKIDKLKHHKLLQIMVVNKETTSSISTFINKSFDLDCCKIMFNGQKFEIFEINNLIRGVTHCNLVDKQITGNLMRQIKKQNIIRISKYYKRGFVVENLDEILEMAYNHRHINDENNKGNSYTTQDYNAYDENSRNICYSYDINYIKRFPNTIKKNHNNTIFCNNDELKVLELSSKKKIVAYYYQYYFNLAIYGFIFQRDIPNLKNEKDKKQLLEMLE